MKQFILLFSVALVIFGCSTNNNGTVTVVPLAPTNLTGSVISTTQINLSWTDNATNEDGYKIERKTGTGNYAVVGSTGSNMTTFSDLGLTPSTSYTYRVYAYNSAGNSIQYSNELTLSTQDSIPSWLTNGLVGYWPFNGNANDESGNGNNGTVNGATLATDRFGNAGKSYSFNGSSNYINCFNPLGNLSSNFTITSYVLMNNWNGGLFVHVGIDQNSFPRDGFGFGYGGTQSIFQGQNLLGLVSNVSWYQSGFQYTNLNTWYHTAVIRSGNSISYYVNGVLVGSNNIATIQTPSNALFFGGGSTNYALLNGKLDDIRIYYRALSASEVAYLAAH